MIETLWVSAWVVDLVDDICCDLSDGVLVAEMLRKRRLSMISLAWRLECIARVVNSLIMTLLLPSKGKSCASHGTVPRLEIYKVVSSFTKGCYHTSHRSASRLESCRLKITKSYRFSTCTCISDQKYKIPG